MECGAEGGEPSHMSRDVRESLTALFAVIAIFGGFWLITGILDQWAMPRCLRVLLIAANFVTLAVAWRHVVRNRRRLRGRVDPPA